MQSRLPQFRLRSIALLLVASTQLTAQQNDQIWREFVRDLREDQVTEDHLRPLYTTKPLMQTLLETMRAEADWREWEVVPEVHQQENRIYYILPLSLGGRKSTFCFTFISTPGGWYLQHFESILLRLDQLGTPPISVFPDAAATQKHWMREEISASEQVRLFNWLMKEKGRQAALDWFRDGRGYALSAAAWVPLLPPHRAFIVYLCWEQARLRGSRVTLNRLDDSEALVTLEPIFLRLYAATSHLRQQISKEDYRALFETVWQDRAVAAGWKLKMDCRETHCIFSFSRTTKTEGL